MLSTICRSNFARILRYTATREAIQIWVALTMGIYIFSSPGNPRLEGGTHNSAFLRFVNLYK